MIVRKQLTTPLYVFRSVCFPRCFFLYSFPRSQLLERIEKISATNPTFGDQASHWNWNDRCTANETANKNSTVMDSHLGCIGDSVLKDTGVSCLQNGIPIISACKQDNLGIWTDLLMFPGSSHLIGLVMMFDQKPEVRNPSRQRVNFKYNFFQLQDLLAYQRNAMGSTYVFRIQLPNGRRENTVWANWNN